MFSVFAPLLLHLHSSLLSAAAFVTTIAPQKFFSSNAYYKYVFTMYCICNFTFAHWILMHEMFSRKRTKRSFQWYSAPGNRQRRHADVRSYERRVRYVHSAAVRPSYIHTRCANIEFRIPRFGFVCVRGMQICRALS